jgi:hypothetical protein
MNEGNYVEPTGIMRQTASSLLRSQAAVLRERAAQWELVANEIEQRGITGDAEYALWDVLHTGVVVR